MSEAGAVAAVTPGPGGSAGMNVSLADANAAPEVDGGESFDRDAALASLGALGTESGEEELAAAAEAEPEKTPEQQTDEERTEARKKRLSDEKGKLSQDKLDGAFAKLTAEGKRLRGKVEAFKAERATFDQAKSQYDAAIEQAATRVNAKEAEFAKTEADFKASPLGVLEKYGWDVPKLVKWIQNDGKLGPEEQIQDTRVEYDKRLQEHSKKVEELENKLKERDFKAAASQYEAKALETMRGLIDKYEFVSKYDLATEVAPKVLQNIAAIYREGGELNGVKYPKGTALDPKTVLDYFESKEAAALARFGIRPGQAGATSGVAKPGAVQPKALSNSDTASRGVKPPSDDSEFDREQAWREVQNLLG